MVFESRVGETFLLGASTWRIEEITHDRVLVSPAPGEPGKMPFWKADAAGRPLELGRAHRRAGAQRSGSCRRPRAIQRLVQHHDLDAQAAENLLRYLADQAAAAGVVPDDRTILIERCRDELGDWRICVLSPFGGRIHAPWAMAVVERARAETGLDVETMWTDDGFVVRFPETDDAARSAADDAGVGRGRGAGPAAARRHGAVRGEVPRSRRRARCCCRSAGPAAAARSGSSASAPRICSRSRRDSARSRCCSRPTASACATSSTCRRWSTTLRRIESARDQDGDRRFDHRLAVRVGAAVRLRRQLHLRRRRAARRAARAGARRSIRRSCASCSAKRSCASCSTRMRWPRSRRSCSTSTRCTSARSVDGVHDLLLRLGDLTAEEIAARSRIDAAPAHRRAGAGAPRDRGQHRRRAAAHAGRVRRPLSRRARRAAADRACRSRCSQPAPNAGARPGAALRAHARAVHHRRTSPRATVSAASTAEPLLKELAADRPAARGRVPARRQRTRVVRPRRAAVDAPPLAGEAAQGGRAGRSAGARPADHDAGRAWSASAAGSTRCSTPSRTCRARRCRRRSSRPRSWRRASTATTRRTSTR